MQIWVSAHSKSYKLDWDPEKSTFVLPGSGQTLNELLAEAAVSQQLNQDIRSVNSNARRLHFLSVLRAEMLVLQLCVGCVSARAWSWSISSAAGVKLPGIRWTWTPDTLYLGGGTPSQMDSGAASAICCGAIPGRPWKEATMEAAPGTITPENVVGLASGRDQSRQPGRAVVRCRGTGTHRPEARLRRWLPRIRAAARRGHRQFQSRSDRRPSRPDARKLERIAGLDGASHAPHVSVYMLEVDEDSRLGPKSWRSVSATARRDIPSDDLIADFYEIAVERLARVGIHRYEISNFARPGLESHHNLKYWRRDPYMGFGADAHSFDGEWRWQNPESIEEYVRGSKPERIASPIPPANISSSAFACSKGITSVNPGDWSAFRPAIERLIRDGLLEADETALRLTARGVLLSNEVFAEFV